MSLFPRSSGILLHPTSLPGKYGIGDLGEHAYRFVDWLAGAGQSVWQILPLGPTSYGDSPYQTLSAFAGNPNLISLDKLIENGWLSSSDLADCPDFPMDKVDYGWVIYYHNPKLRLAYQNFLQSGTTEQKQAFSAWKTEQAYWLEDYSLFIALKDHHEGRPWVEWAEELVRRDDSALEKSRQELAELIDEHCWKQWVFHEQWMALKQYANGKGIRLFGDLPIFVAHDSADVWANQDEYMLDETGNPTVIAGVPPDYFSPTGQRWGNPLYRWDVMKSKGYDWWIRRFQYILQQVDYIRVDHFRGFDAYWQIPATEETAVNGQWITGPGHDLFQAVQNALGALPIIAEDLGVITPTVEKLRDDFGLPGMKVLQFAWSGPDNPFLPHNYTPNSVVYTGTHDNNTSVGWWNHEANEGTKNFVREYVGHNFYEISWTLIQMAMRSVSHTAIFPLQDVLSLERDARMNTPSVPSGNWQWRMKTDALSPSIQHRLAHLTHLYQRRADQQAHFVGDPAM